MMTDSVWRFLALAALVAAAIFGVQAWTGQRLKLMYRAGDPLFLPSDAKTQRFHGWTAAFFGFMAVIAFVLSIALRPA